MSDLYIALEFCLTAIEHGAEIEDVLARHPEFADELRPLLQASVEAKSLSPAGPAAEVVRRNRAKVLQRAAEVRESTSTMRPRFAYLPPLRRVAATMVILILVLASGTSLVSAATTSLPGDKLYPVKRSWEGLQIVLSFSEETREALEIDHENERIQELQALFNSKRSIVVTFNGILTRQSGTDWLVAGIPVVIAPETILPLGQVQVNDAVQVHGLTQADGSVIATSIQALGPGAILPEVDDASQEDEPASGVATEMPEIIPTQTVQPEGYQFDGVLNVKNGDFWTINGIPSDVSGAEVEGLPVVGASVTVEGYFNSDGVFIVTKIKFDNTRTGEGRGAGADSNSNSNGNSNEDPKNNNDDDNGNDR